MLGALDICEALDVGTLWIPNLVGKENQGAWGTHPWDIYGACCGRCSGVGACQLLALSQVYTLGPPHLLGFLGCEARGMHHDVMWRAQGA